MVAERWWALALLTVFFSNLAASPAHDLASGPTMGSPPRVSEAGLRLLQLIPAGMDQPTQRRARGVIDRARMWPQNQVLAVCFLSGSRTARARVAAVAVEWANYVNVRLDFGDISDPRSCSGGGSGHIKIDFLSSGPDSGHWSYVGIDSWQFPHSMNLHGFGGDALPVAAAEHRGVVLHEFGHALGFAHEHQSPDAKCDAEFDAKKLEAWATRMGWSQADVKTNLARLQPTTSLVFTRHDKKSIMHYSLPEELFRDGRNNRCWVPKNNELSEGDKTFAASMYPPRVASINDESTGGQGMRRVPAAAPEDPRKIEAGYRAQLQGSFKAALAQGGVESTEADSLAAKFQEEIAKLRSGPRPGDN